MTWEEMLEHLTFEYHSYRAAIASDNEWLAQTFGSLRQQIKPFGFYDYLLARGFNRWQLSAHGIGRDVEA